MRTASTFFARAEAGDQKIISMMVAVAIKLSLVATAYLLPHRLLDLLGVGVLDHFTLTNYTPEIWISLLALVFGTLIIVVSIASEKTPRLIDLFITEPKGRLYIWLIMFSCLENIFLQLFTSDTSVFISNLIFINSYVLLPCFILLAIPYTFYILENTKTSKVIERIYYDNVRAIFSTTRDDGEVSRMQGMLFETTNQLHDLLQYIQFQEPKGDVIHKMGKSLRHYLRRKRHLPDGFFKLTKSLKEDISFRSLGDKFRQIEVERTFYEHKVLRVLCTTYLHLIRESHHDLASLCGSELCETGKVAIALEDHTAAKTIIFHFNTFLRYGINQGLKSREIRHVYNTLFHYSQLVEVFVARKDEQKVLQCCRHYAFYANEVSGLGASDAVFVFLIEAFSWELKKILVAIHRGQFPHEFQKTVLNLFTTLVRHRGPQNHSSHGSERLIQIALCLYYFRQQEDELKAIVAKSLLEDLLRANTADVESLIDRECAMLVQQQDEFWEETDQGNRNIFYSPDVEALPQFREFIMARLERSKNLAGQYSGH